MSYSIIISLSGRRLTLLSNNSIVKNYPIGVGKPSTPTPAGNYTIISKVPNPGGPYGAMWLGLSRPSYGIHGTNNPASIGGLVSKGCIRMYNHDVLQLAALIPIGTPVMIRP